MKLRRLIHPLLMIIVLAIAFSLYGTWYARVGSESANAVALTGKIEEAKQAGVRTQEAKKQLENAASDEAAIRGYFVNTADVVPFLESLQSTGSRFGAKVEVVSVSSDAAKPHARLLLSLRITGPFDSVERTLGAVEYEPYDTVVQTLTLDTPKEQGGSAAQWTAAVTMSVGTIDIAAAAPAKPAAPAQATSTPAAPVAQKAPAASSSAATATTTTP